MTTLSPMARQFVSHFGEMGGKWGINRIAAQVFALLYLSPQPLTATALCDALNFSRSHVGTALKDLERWRLINTNRPSGDRRDHFTVTEDVWEIARILVEERRHREIEPTRAMLRRTVEMQPKTDEERHMHDKIKEMNNLLHLLTDWYDDMQKIETKQLVRMLKLGSKVVSLYTHANPLRKKSPKQKED